MVDESLFDEITRMNNELINARRELTRLNERLDEKTRFLERIIELSPNIIYVYDIAAGQIDFSNDRGKAADLLSRMSQEDKRRYTENTRKFLGCPDGNAITFEFGVKGGDGADRWFLCHESVFQRDAAGVPIKLVGIAEDVSTLKAREQDLLHAARFDQLTGLHNRRGFMEAAETHRGGKRRPREPFAVIFFDLDRFKEINDRFGHDEGDRALIALAEILAATFRSSDLTGRMGGDEFVALADGADGPIVDQLLLRFEAKLRQWNAESGKEWQLRSSYGYALYDPSAPLDFEELLKRADEAMYEAKRKKKAS